MRKHGLNEFEEIKVRGFGLPKILKFKNYSEDELCILARYVGDNLRIGDSILFNGPVGVGKTFFISCLIKKQLSDMGKEDFITSPTFNLVQIYDDLPNPIWHVDLYRLKKSSELIEIGLEQALHEAVCLVEWPDLLDKCITHRAVTVSLSFSLEDSGKRDIKLSVPTKNMNNQKFDTFLDKVICYVDTNR